MLSESGKMRFDKAIEAIGLIFIAIILIGFVTVTSDTGSKEITGNAITNETTEVPTPILLTAAEEISEKQEAMLKETFEEPLELSEDNLLNNLLEKGVTPEANKSQENISIIVVLKDQPLQEVSRAKTFEIEPIIDAYTAELNSINAKTAINLTGNWNCDAVITSPPYINAIDYVWASKFELHWLGLVSNDRERLDLYTQEIGTERISRNEYCQLGKTGNAYLDNLIADIYYGTQYQASKGQNQLRARVVYKYFMDMKAHFLSCFNHLNAGGYYCFAIGDISKICGVEIPVAKLLTEIAEEIGFVKLFQFHLLLKNRRLNLPRNVKWAGTIKHDTVVVLQKGKI